MKKLIFVRHGRAEDPAPEFSDFERSLTTKGKAIARRISLELLEKETTPGIMITSPAFRALETAIIFALEFRVNPENIVLDSNIYHKMNFKYLIEILSDVSKDTDTITLFGHNPSFSEITNSLCKNGCDSMPKCGVATISFDIKKWSDIKRNTGNLEYFLKPEKTL